MKHATTHRRASRVFPSVATAFAAAILFARVPPAEPGAKLFDAPSRVTATASRVIYLPAEPVAAKQS